MDSYNFQDLKEEKENAILRYRRKKRITALFRLVEVIVFLIILSRVPTEFPFSFKISSEYVRGISVNLISPRFVFLLGNAIIVVLFLISGQFSGKNGGTDCDFYDEYVEKCRNNQQIIKEETKASDYKYRVCYDEKKISRSHSENLERAVRLEERRRDLRRNMSEKCRKSVDCGRKVAEVVGSSPGAEDELSGEEFRRKVEAFIARQQRFLREEEFSAVVSV
ncbi:hypothetical protein CDL12_12193 [Handroanthus impetiginosus]|uniref:DUF4408 domain-containing protein n=1 Tax=Handroanthus impetiginosus TaxID=429701 RepID=A0A2G9HCA1_9LAMI|nr:hypothetical protein CDL12_12193 [Handroanthus impetiginosus]